MLASYQRINAVRERIGFAEMTNHGWLMPDRSLQFSDWGTGDRVIVNFGDWPIELDRDIVPARSFLMRKGK